MWRSRSIDKHLRTMMPRLSSPHPSSMALAICRQFSRANPCLVAPSSLHHLSITTTLNFQRSVLSLILRPRISSFSSSRPGVFIVRCFSSTPSIPTLDWNEPVSCSEVGDGYNSDMNEAETRPYIPVRAYFFSTSVDLRSLVDQNKANFIPPTSRMTNYVVLRFRGSKLGANVSLPPSYF
ncbi:hypothetical protein NE237_008288 [Protea cynaroides]|uniref:Uncharacterized protein n=1 Tax=Protea cynaroides TaxID=273540 RepID=A0A9Q0GKU4_9MAGN|nr:hypothetical protein NE237_008288 [Protea cynaroides]